MKTKKRKRERNAEEGETGSRSDTDRGRDVDGKERFREPSWFFMFEMGEPRISRMASW